MKKTKNANAIRKIKITVLALVALAVDIILFLIVFKKDPSVLEQLQLMILGWPPSLLYGLLNTPIWDYVKHLSEPPEASQNRANMHINETCEREAVQTTCKNEVNSQIKQATNKPDKESIGVDKLDVPSVHTKDDAR